MIFTSCHSRDDLKAEKGGAKVNSGYLPTCLLCDVRYCLHRVSCCLPTSVVGDVRYGRGGGGWRKGTSKVTPINLKTKSQEPKSNVTPFNAESQQLAGGERGGGVGGGMPEEEEEEEERGVGFKVQGYYTPKSNTRNRAFSTNCTRNACTCLRACCAMSSTGVVYGAISIRCTCSAITGTTDPSVRYQATPSPVLKESYGPASPAYGATSVLRTVRY
eukprot:3222206-Rhodomonas_salina.2